ncbi:Benomyl/methotrexate resistance protein [Tolypocladium ophioglossoides CBS 100239]|uniref:Benomyl/methotrexate resistance protein n=1 Tax=Tolypocladium ophioglossoides (strain CBS 100239) TaxID=1163406 RepID=A0A0L0NCR2_TOLOC|nr:Benomyl/methotrexate resistance protein [Tolypocladium ophioglossoides CBS 100239]
MTADVPGRSSDVEAAPASDAPTEVDAANDKPAAADGHSDSETARKLDWDREPSNPRNWPTWKKALQMLSVSSMAFVASVATSIMSPARAQLMDDFGVSSTVALVPLALYVFALGFGPVVGGPLSETLGRQPVYVGSLALGALFTLGAGLARGFGAVCVLRFLAGFCWAPLLAVPSATIAETFEARARGPVSAVFILMPFLGPGLG